MVLGMWTNWLKAVSELIILLGIVSLPLLRERRRKRQTRARINQNIHRLTLTLLANPQRDVQWQTDYQSLQTLLSVYASLATSGLETVVTETGRDLLDLIGKATPSRQAVDQQLAALTRCQ
ncbi:hypothetical protein KB236_04980 [Levilactobacillus brevis]|uniref:Uncharacterized protein n=1 Tax=Levilactobacillus hammesii TaxID=267633 RepID=A0A921JVU9_9LACO|nr:hypothetical protein KB236_04980 [Levilactobacillus brevis]HJE86169.1 hypothetical protein [Levilactobacillus hammesii]